MLPMVSIDFCSAVKPPGAAQAASPAISAATPELRAISVMLAARLATLSLISADLAAMRFSSCTSLVTSKAYLTIFTTRPLRSRIGL